MKIEIGESLIASWLKHIEKCQVVQLNWKPSTSFWQIDNYNEIEKVINYAIDYFEKEYGFKLFKNTKSVGQIIKQAELDVLGIQLEKGKLERVYSVDVAFHEGGLTYGSKNETAAHIAKKILRTVICINGYFGVRSGEIIFASPKVNKRTLNEIVPLIEGIERILKIFHFNFNILFIANEDFEQRIVNPVIQASSKVADTSELFMGSVQMMKPFQSQLVESLPIEKDERTFQKTNQEISKAISQTASTTLSTKNHPQFSNRIDLKIGQLVRSVFRYIEDHGLLKEDEISFLVSKRHSKEIFDINYPVLLELDMAKEISMQISDNKGHPRYFKRHFYEINNKKYALTSEWHERSRTKLERWLSNRGLY